MCANVGRMPGRCHFTLIDPTKGRTGAVKIKVHVVYLNFTGHRTIPKIDIKKSYDVWVKRRRTVPVNDLWLLHKWLCENIQRATLSMVKHMNQPNMTVESKHYVGGHGTLPFVQNVFR